jgi:hypothetical protein
VGVCYAQYVVPVASAVRWRPSPETIARLVERLVELRWIDAAWRTVPLVGTEHVSKAARRSVAEDVGVFAALENPLVIGPFAAPPAELFWGEERLRSDGRGRAYDFGDEPGGLLKPGYQDEVRLIVARDVCLVPTNAYSEVYPDSEPCPRCGADLVCAVDGSRTPDDAASWFSAAGVHRFLPTPCAACGGDVAIEELGHLPLFQFAVQIDPPMKSTPGDGDGMADPELLEALHDITGVAFDMIPAWS